MIYSVSTSTPIQGIGCSTEKRSSLIPAIGSVIEGFLVSLMKLMTKLAKVHQINKRERVMGKKSMQILQFLTSQHSFQRGQYFATVFKRIVGKNCQRFQLRLFDFIVGLFAFLNEISFPNLY